MTEKLENICGDVLNNINEKENKIMNEREYIIAKAKELGITAEELGIAPVVKTVTEKDDDFIRQVGRLLSGFEIDAEDARDYFAEDYWEDLGIAEKKYKIVKATVKKTIYKDVYVAMPEDENDYNVNEYLDNLDNLDNDYPDDEEEWEVDDYEVDEEGLTENEVNNRSQDEIWNYDDFAD